MSVLVLFVFLKHGVNHKDESQNSNYILSGYNFFYQYRQYRRGGECVFSLKNRFVAKLDKICQ